MSRTKSITDLVTQLQLENEQSKYYYKLFSQAVKHEFGYSVDELHDVILKYKAYESRAHEHTANKQGQ